jgi:2-phosphosulfolactate phosphatase
VINDQHRYFGDCQPLLNDSDWFRGTCHDLKVGVRFVDIEGASGIDGGTAVVIDVMRAYTVAAWALHLGAKELRLVGELEDAVSLAASVPGALLFKDGAPDPRFQLHNSPKQLLDLNVVDRTIVQRTTAGTRAALAARRADHLYCASFVCASATAAELHRYGTRDVTFVVSGGLDADEDLACAEFVAEVLEGKIPAADPFIQRANASAAANDLRDGVVKGFSGVTDQDVPMCLEIDRFDFAMQARPTPGGLRLTQAETRIGSR